MKVNEIKRTIEEVVRVEYIADDGTVFRDKAECEKYEESALFVVKRKLKSKKIAEVNQYDLFDFGHDECVEIFDIQTEEELDNLKKYLYLYLSVVKEYSEKYIMENYSSDGITCGHEVLVFWNYDDEGFYCYGDGSLNGYFDIVRRNFDTIANRKKEEN